MAPEHLFQRHRDLADGRLGARRIDRERQQIAVAAVGRAGERGERFLHRLRIALGLQPRELVELQRAHRRIVDLEHVDRLLVGRAILVHADDRLRAAVDARLRLGGGFLDAQLRDAGLDRLGHAAELFDLLDMAPGLLGELGGQPLDIERAAPRIDDARGAALLLQEELRVARDARGEIGRQRQRLVERIGVQRLGVALRRRHRLDRGAHHVVEDVLRGRATSRRSGNACAARASARPSAPNCFISFAQIRRAARSLATSMKKFMPIAQKNERRGAKRSMSSPAFMPGAHIFDAVGERVGELEVLRRARLLHVIAGDRDRIELRHAAREA